MGGAVSFVKQTFPGKPQWTADDLQDLSGKVALVTGGNTGVGRETVKALLQHNVKVYLAARSASKAAAAIDELKTETGKEAVFLHLDLADLRSVRKAAEEFLSKENVLHVLFNNAGVMMCPMDYLTAQGYDMQVGTNVMGHFHLTMLLMPALEAASASGEKARIVNTSSSAAYLAKGFFYDSAKDGPARKKRNPTDMYFVSKLGNVLFTREMARRYGDKVVSIAVNPGNIRTELQRHLPIWKDAIMNTILFPSPFGAITQLWGGLAQEAEVFNGKFLVPWARVGPMPALAKDPASGEELWTWLEQQCKDF